MTNVEDAGGSAGAAVRALLDALGMLMGAMPEGRWIEATDLVSYSSGLLAPRLNGVIVLGEDADRGPTDAWLEHLASRSLPYGIFARPHSAQWVDRLAAAHGLTTVENEPFMCHVDPRELAEDAPDGFTIDVLDPADPEQVAIGARLLADGFEAPRGVLDRLAAPEVLSLVGITSYIGRAGGRPCTTGLGAVRDGYVGVFNIATPPPYRRRGFGRSVTARVVADGVRAGAHTAYLQASAMGQGLYERMGFRTVESWSCYYPP